MSYGSKVTGHITIVPPLNAMELRASRQFQKEGCFSGGPDQECYVEVERQTETTLEGETVKLSGPRVLVTSPDSSFSRYKLEEQLQMITSSYYPLGHQFTGYFELTSEDDDKWRLVVRDGVVKEIKPELIWPDE
jgi:hypothetical protein